MPNSPRAPSPRDYLDSLSAILWLFLWYIGCDIFFFSASKKKKKTCPVKEETLSRTGLAWICIECNTRCRLYPQPVPKSLQIHRPRSIFHPAVSPAGNFLPLMSSCRGRRHPTWESSDPTKITPGMFHFNSYYCWSRKSCCSFDWKKDWETLERLSLSLCVCVYSCTFVNITINPSDHRDRLWNPFHVVIGGWRSSSGQTRCLLLLFEETFSSRLHRW